MKVRLLMLAVLFGLTCTGFKCNSSDVMTGEIQVRAVGEFVSVNSIPSSWNEAVKTKVETTMGQFIIWGNASGVKGDPVFLKSNDDWKTTFLYIGNGKNAHYVF